MVGLKKLNLKDYKNTIIPLDNIDYHIFYKRNISGNIDAPRIMIVSYQPNPQASKITRMAIETIRKFTDSDYELWVIDNCSPEQNIGWMDNYDDLNLVFIRTQPREAGSYANGLALEMASRLIDEKSKYVVTFHLDIAVAGYGWLKFMLSKLNEKVRACGFRLTKERVKEGVLHVCGYLIDFQLFKKLNLSFMPELPDFDIGDRIIYEFMKNGYEICPIRNTFDDENLIEIIPDTLKVKKLNVTRAFDDDNNVIYMHLGRGILKSQGKYDNPSRTNAEQWIEYINTCLLSNISCQKLNTVYVSGSEISYDYKNFDLDDFVIHEFFKDKIKNLPGKPRILFVDGKPDFKLNKNIMSLFTDKTGNPLTVFYNSPDYEIKQQEFDCVVFSDIDYINKIKEEDLSLVFSTLRKGGVFIGIHHYEMNKNVADNEGVKIYLNKVSGILWKSGFKEVCIEQMGNERFTDFKERLNKYMQVNIKRGIEENSKKFHEIEGRFLSKELNKLLKNYNKEIDFKKYINVPDNINFGIYAVK